MLSLSLFLFILFLTAYPYSSRPWGNWDDKTSYFSLSPWFFHRLSQCPWACAPCSYTLGSFLSAAMRQRAADTKFVHKLSNTPKQTNKIITFKIKVFSVYITRKREGGVNSVNIENENSHLCFIPAACLLMKHESRHSADAQTSAASLILTVSRGRVSWTMTANET